MIQRILSVVAMLSAPLLLVGCQSGPNPAVEILRTVFFDTHPTGAGLDPKVAYLRVTSRQRVAFFALGYVDPHPQGAIEVWYSANLETLRLQNGRVLGITGTLAEWRQVRLPVFPSWAELVARDEVFNWTRTRDLMPGYYFNVRDDMQLQRISVPEKSVLTGLEASSLRWFEERMKATSVGGDSLPPARYAVQLKPDEGQVEVVYGEQCITPDFCITWQRWTAKP